MVSAFTAFHITDVMKASMINKLKLCKGKLLKCAVIFLSVGWCQPTEMRVDACASPLSNNSAGFLTSAVVALQWPPFLPLDLAGTESAVYTPLSSIGALPTVGKRGCAKTMCIAYHQNRRDSSLRRFPEILARISAM